MLVCSAMVGNPSPPDYDLADRMALTTLSEVKAIGHPSVMRAFTEYGLPRPWLMRFALRATLLQGLEALPHVGIACAE